MHTSLFEKCMEGKCSSSIAASAVALALDARLFSIRVTMRPVLKSALADNETRGLVSFEPGVGQANSTAKKCSDATTTMTLVDVETCHLFERHLQSRYYKSR